MKEYKFISNNPEINKRREMFEKIKDKYPNQIPIICEKDPNSNLSQIKTTKFLISNKLSAAEFYYTIRKELKLDPSKSLFLIVDGKQTFSGNTSMQEIYSRHKSKEDGFLYISYTGRIVCGVSDCN